MTPEDWERYHTGYYEPIGDEPYPYDEDLDIEDNEDWRNE